MQQRRKTSSLAPVNGQSLTEAEKDSSLHNKLETAPATPSKSRRRRPVLSSPPKPRRDLLDTNGKKSKKNGTFSQLLRFKLQQVQYDPKTRRLAVAASIVFASLFLFLLLPRYNGIYASKQEENDRRLRFPSIELRTKTYMSNWYVPPCPDSHSALLHFAVIDLRSEEELLPPMLGGRTKNHKVYTNNSTETQKPRSIKQYIIQELEGLHPQRRGIYVIQDVISYAQVLYMTPQNLVDCDNFTNNEYCPDYVETLLPAVDRVDRQAHTGRKAAHHQPVMTQMGDSGVIRGYNIQNKKWDPFPSLPIVMKYRFAFEDPDAVTAMTAADCIRDNRPIYYTQDTMYAPKYHDYYQPIVWKVTSSRHLGMIPKIPENDIPYEQKVDMAVFRGALTGVHRDGYTAAMKGKISDHEKCLLIHRCRLVYKTAGSRLVDAKLTTAKVNEAAGVEEEIPPMIGSVEMYARTKYMYDKMLTFKALIMLEGNDISSGLKWALYSNSVVMTQPPTKTSWAMEELLEPWVHYVPLNQDLSDVEEKMQWILDNEEAAKKIARAGTLWIKDLVLHPDAAHEDDLIYDEMIRRYRSHFVYKPGLEKEHAALLAEATENRTGSE